VPYARASQGLHGLPVPWRRDRARSYSSIRSSDDSEHGLIMDDSNDSVFDDDYEILAVRNDSVDIMENKDETSLMNHPNQQPQLNEFSLGRLNNFQCPPLPPAPSERDLASEIRRWVPNSIPGRILRGCGGDVVEASKRCALTALWRKNYKVDNLLQFHPPPVHATLGGITSSSGVLGEGWSVVEPQPLFHTIKKLYPHVIHGRSSQGNHPIYIEKVGVALSNLAQLTSLGVGVNELVRHYTLNQEYMWRVICNDADDAQAVTLFDIAGVSMGMLSNMEVVRAVMNICQQHYVERSCRIFVVNAPFWFAAPWKVTSYLPSFLHCPPINTLFRCNSLSLI
jgi:hypothetical protein